MKKITLTFSALALGTLIYAQNPKPAATKPGVKAEKVSRGKVNFSTDMDCHILWNGKLLGNLKAGKNKIGIGTFGPNELEAISGFTTAQPGTLKEKMPAPPAPKDPKAPKPPDPFVFKKNVIISDTGLSDFAIVFMGEQMLGDFIRSGNKTAVEDAIKKNPGIVKPSDDAINPLNIAAEKGKTEIVQLLLDKGADVNLKTEDTPLNCAIRGGKAEIVKLFVEKGADIEARGENGRKPIQEAVFWGKYEAVKILLEKGANAKEKDGEGTSLLQLATDKGLDSIADELKKYGASEN